MKKYTALLAFYYVFFNFSHAWALPKGPYEEPSQFHYTLLYLVIIGLMGGIMTAIKVCGIYRTFLPKPAINAIAKVNLLGLVLFAIIFSTMQANIMMCFYQDIYRPNDVHPSEAKYTPILLYLLILAAVFSFHFLTEVISVKKYARNIKAIAYFYIAVSDAVQAIVFIKIVGYISMFAGAYSSSAWIFFPIGNFCKTFI